MESKFFILIVVSLFVLVFSFLLFGLVCAPIAWLLWLAAKGLGHPLPYVPIWLVLIVISMMFGRGKVDVS